MNCKILPNGNVSNVIPLGLSRARNAFGERVIDNAEYKAKLLAVIENLNEETWDEAYCIILAPDKRAPSITLWKAVCAVDPKFPKTGPTTRNGRRVTGWARIPSRDTIIEAVEYATALVVG